MELKPTLIYNNSPSPLPAFPHTKSLYISMNEI